MKTCAVGPTVIRKLPPRFPVAFSFAGEHRELVRSIAEAVEVRLGAGTVFLDEWFEHYLAGADADLKLQTLYGEHCDLVVLCVSGRYGGKAWTQAEHEAIRGRLMQARASGDERDQDAILPIRVGDGDVKGIHLKAIVPDVRTRSADDTADLILARLALISRDGPSPGGPTQPVPTQPVPNHPADPATPPPGRTGVHPSPPRTRCSNAETQSLSDALDAAHAELERRLSNGEDAAHVRAHILELRRRIRAGGRLRAGDLLLDGRYKLVEQLKQGGFGTIYRAYDRKRHDLVAIKVLHGQYADDRTRIERFFRGARKMWELAHPGIVQVLEPELHEEGHHFFVMEYLAGGDLRDAVLSRPLPPEQTLDLIEAVGQALEHAHAQGVVHRDVKPANIVLDAQLNPKLMDFDLVRAGDTTGGTRTGFLGSFGYAAPEAMSRAKEADARADVYGLGMTAVFALRGDDPDFMQMLRDPQALLAELPIPEPVRAVLQRATAWQAADRFGSVGAFRDALTAARRAAPEAPTPLGSVPGPGAPEAVVRPIGHPTPFRDTCADGSPGPEMVWLLGGTFTMGSPEGVGEDREQPAHQVLLSHYSVGKYPVTVGEFRRFVEATGYRTEAEQGDGAYVLKRGNPGRKADASWRNPYLDQDDHHPVVCISWNDATAYCEWLSGETGQSYGLLTEAQWEHACRAGTDTRWYCGDDEARLKDHAWYRANAGDGTHPVGEKRANAFGLHDLHGNVWEWCADWYADDTYARRGGSASRTGETDNAARNGPHGGADDDSKRAATAGTDASGTGGKRSDAAATASGDPSGPSAGSDRVVRGGAWNRNADDCRSACRIRSEPSSRSLNLGFRLSRTGPLSSYPFTLGRGAEEPAMQDIKPENRNPAMMPAPDFAKPEQGAGSKERLMQYDCFLSYNSKDRRAVRDLAKRLADAGLSTWLDEAALQPGLPVQPQMEAGIRASRSVAVLVGADGMGPWQDEEQQAALVLAVRDKRPVIPVLLPGAPAKPDLPMFLQNRHWVDLRAADGNDADAGFERLLRGIIGTRADPRETPARQSVPRLSKTRRGALEQQLSLLTEQWEAALQESALSTGAARVRADQQAQQLEQRIRDIERQLDEGAP